jgi:diketogulonate reductase-like aldo/keto reductase
MWSPSFSALVTLWMAIGCCHFGFSLSDGDEVVSMPKLGLGTAALGSRTEAIVNYSLHLGVRLIDTAQAKEWYEEKAVARAVESFPNDSENPIFVVTKIHPRSFKKEKMKTKLTESANNFKTHGIDAVLLHSSRCWSGHCTPEEERVTWKEGWTNLEQLKDEFSIKMIGVSNFDLPLLQELVLSHTNRKVAVVQNWMDPFHQDKPVRDFCHQHGIQYMAYSSLGTQWYNQEKNPVFNSAVLQSIARNHRSSVSAVVLSWLSAEEAIAIPRCSSEKHLKENFEKSCSSSSLCRVNSNSNNNGLLSLSEEELQRIRSLDGTLGEGPWE